jgi:exopolysaccharide production protein ExoZ
MRIDAPSRSRIDSLDLLRGLMALSVAVYHLSIWTGLFPAGSRANNAIAVFGNYGVEGFFVVSGFCFFHLYGEMKLDGPSLKRFHVKRFLRIAPLYYVAVLLSLLLRPPFGTTVVGPDASLRMLAENFSLSFGLFHPNHSLVLGGWSIGLEYVFYLAFPLLAFLTRRKVLLYVLAGAFILLAWPWNFGAVQAALHAGDQKFHTYVQIPNHAFLFLLGGIVAHLRSLTARRLPSWAFLALVLGLFLLALPKGPVFYDHFEVMAGLARAKYAGLCFLTVLAFAFMDLPRSPWTRPLTMLGDLSYSVYLLHPFAYLAIHGMGLGPLQAFALGLAITLCLATASYRWLEKPAMEMGRRVA